MVLRFSRWHEFGNISIDPNITLNKFDRSSDETHISHAFTYLD